jgi:t-SNARE complex subunit (syntaxin)
MSDVVVTRDDFMAFARVRRSGEYNMLDSNARHMAGLSKEKWLEIIRQYSEFENKYKEDKE